MVEAILTFSVSIFLAYIARWKKYEYTLILSFFILFIFLVIRFDYGNDYSNYLKEYLSIKNLGHTIRKSSALEVGYIFLNKIFPNFFFLIFSISLFYIVTFYYFIKNNVPPALYWFAVFIFIFYPSIFLVNLSGLRQTIAMTFIMIGIMCQNKGRRWGLIISILLGSLFHYTCLVLLPLILINKSFLLKNKIEIYLFIISITIIVASPFINEYTNYLKFFSEDFHNRYIQYFSSKTRSFSIFNILSRLVVIVLLIANFKFLKTEDKYYSFLAILFFSFSFVGYYNYHLDRFFSYLAPYIIIAIPISMKSINIKVRYFLSLFFIVLYLNYFIGFITSNIWAAKYGTYKTIFSKEASNVFE